MPNVSVDQAIKISQARRGGGAGAGSGKALTWQEESEISEAEVEAARERIIMRLKRLGERQDREREEAGWTKHGDDWIPPGWVRVETSES